MTYLDDKKSNIFWGGGLSPHQALGLPSLVRQPELEIGLYTSVPVQQKLAGNLEWTACTLQDSRGDNMIHLCGGLYSPRVLQMDLWYDVQISFCTGTLKHGLASHCSCARSWMLLACVGLPRQQQQLLPTDTAIDHLVMFY